MWQDSPTGTLKEMLRRRGGGVAKRSMHLQGRAIDVRLTYEAIPDTGHLLQIEKPMECIAALASFFDEHGIEV